MSPTRLGYKELGPELVSLEEKSLALQMTSHGRRNTMTRHEILSKISRGSPHVTEE
jgi:hypothetical protein